MFLVTGGPGQGCSDVLRAMSRAAGDRRTVWIDAVTGDRLGAHAIVSVHDHGQRPGRPAGPVTPLVALLEGLRSELSGDGLLVLIDGYHLLGRDDAAAVVEWLQERRFSDTVVVIGTHPVECRPSCAQELAHLPATTTIDLPRLDADTLTALLVTLHPECPPPSLRQIAEFSHGVPDLACEAAEHLATEPDPTVVEPSLRVAVHRVGTSLLGHLAPTDARLALASVLAVPEGSVSDVAAVLEIDRAEAPRVEALLDQVGLLGGDRERCSLIRDALLSGADPQHVRDAASAVLGLLERVDACPSRILELLELLGAEDGNYLTVARQAFEGCLARGEDERAQELALQALRRSQCPDVVAWARSAVLGLAITRDWSRARSMIASAGASDELVRQLVAGEDLPLEFSLDAAPAVGSVTETVLGEPHNALCPQLAMVVHRHLLAGRPASARAVSGWRAASEGPVHPVELSSVLVAALRGMAAEDWLARLEGRLTERVGRFNVGAHSAALVAAAHLVLANHEAAREWSNVATITAGPGDRTARGFANVVAAEAQLRLGNLEEASTRAAVAAEEFRSVRAHQLVAFAEVAAAHVDIEAGRRGQLPPDTGERGHPVLDGYASYVRARHDLAEGRVDAGVQTLFGVGRRLETLGLANPTLVNWRPHLISLFRAGHEEGFARSVEEDLIRSMRRWHRSNPVSARRRSHILGAHAHELLPHEPRTDSRVNPPVSPDVQAELSDAEARVVRLVVQGRSNRETARELYLSKRTVDTHLSNVYRKLGLRSRDELGTYLRDKPLQHIGEAHGAPAAAGPVPIYG